MERRCRYRQERQKTENSPLVSVRFFQEIHTTLKKKDTLLYVESGENFVTCTKTCDIQLFGIVGVLGKQDLGQVRRGNLVRALLS